MIVVKFAHLVFNNYHSLIVVCSLNVFGIRMDRQDISRHTSIIESNSTVFIIIDLIISFNCFSRYHFKSIQFIV